MYTRSDLLKRGWTQAMITRFAPEPDITKINPRFKNAAPMKLYRPERIHEIEESEAFLKASEQSKGRRAGARKAAETKRRDCIGLVESIEIQIADEPNLLGNAISSYNTYRASVSDGLFKIASKRSDPLFLERISVNYARHHLTGYDSQIELLYRKVGKQEAYLLLKKRTLAAIALKYPHLADECRRQAKEGVEISGTGKSPA